MTKQYVNASQRKLILCHSCETLHAEDKIHSDHRCPNCRAKLHQRVTYSVGASWAYLLTAAILYIPANILPMMFTHSVFGDEADTIMSGIIYFWTSGSYDLACIIFIASIGVPLFKLSALALLLISVQRGWGSGERWRATLYRIVEFIGRWSMLDVFVVTLMVGLVRFQGLATIDAGPAAASFAGVVIFTMFSAKSFDPRLIWDKALTHDNE